MGFLPGLCGLCVLCGRCRRLVSAEAGDAEVVQTGIAAAVENQVRHQFRRDRREQDAVAVVARGVKDTGLRRVFSEHGELVGCRRAEADADLANGFAREAGQQAPRRSIGALSATLSLEIRGWCPPSKGPQWSRDATASGLHPPRRRSVALRRPRDRAPRGRGAGRVPARAAGPAARGAEGAARRVGPLGGARRHVVDERAPDDPLRLLRLSAGGVRDHLASARRAASRGRPEP